MGNFLADAALWSPRAEEVARDIKERIASKNLPDGHRLGTKVDLKAEYGVATATLNEAVRLLSARKIIKVRPGVNGGIFVASPPVMVRLGQKMLELTSDSVSVADCLVMRETLEPLVIREASRHQSASDIDELRAHVNEMIATELNPYTYLRAVWALHRQIVDITPNDILKHVYCSLLEFIESRVESVNDEDGSLDITQGVNVHKDLVEAIASRDRNKVSQAIEAHAVLTNGCGEA